jgi:hypothetical protein
MFGEGVASVELVLGSPTRRLVLGSCSPNPMNLHTRIPYELATSGRASVKIYDVGGWLVRTLLSGDLEAGTGSLTWDGLDAGGRAVASGVYFIRLEAPDGERTQSVTLLR